MSIRRIRHRRSASSGSMASRIVSSGTFFPALFNWLSNETGPAGLMAGADAGTIIAVKVFVEKDEVAPVRIALKKFAAASYRPAPFRIAQKNVNEPPRDFSSHLPEIGFRARVRRTLDFEIFAVIVVKFLKRFHEQVVDRKPDGPTPIGIAAEKTGRGFRRLVVHTVRISVHVYFVGMILVKARKSAHAEGRKKFRLVQHAAKHAF